jgi:hypothetical protein
MAVSAPAYRGLSSLGSSAANAAFAANNSKQMVASRLIVISFGVASNLFYLQG